MAQVKEQIKLMGRIFTNGEEFEENSTKFYK